MKNQKRTAIITAIVMTVILFVLPELVSFVKMMNPEAGPGNPVLSGILQLPLVLLLPCLIISFWYMRRYKISATQFFSLRGLSLSQVALLVPIALLMPFVINVFIQLTSGLVGKLEIVPMMTPDGNASFGRQAGVFLYNLLFFALMPGICEEAFFRGAFLSLMKDSKVKAGIAIVLSALLFALFHKNPAQMLYTIVLGLVFTLVVYYTKSLYAGILTHTLYNFVYVLRFALDPKAYPWVGKLSDVFVNTSNIWLALVCAAAITGLLYHLRPQGGISTAQE